MIIDTTTPEQRALYKIIDDLKAGGLTSKQQIQEGLMAATGLDWNESAYALIDHGKYSFEQNQYAAQQRASDAILAQRAADAARLNTTAEAIAERDFQSTSTPPPYQSYPTPTPTYTQDQTTKAINEARAQGSTDADIVTGLQRYGLTLSQAQQQVALNPTPAPPGALTQTQGAANPAQGALNNTGYDAALNGGSVIDVRGASGNAVTPGVNNASTSTASNQATAVLRDNTGAGSGTSTLTGNLTQAATNVGGLITNNPGKFTAAQVAAYLSDNKVDPKNYASTAAAFGIPTSLLNEGIALMMGKDPSVAAASTTYANTATPAQVTANDAWATNQLAATPTQQQRELGVVEAYKNPSTTVINPAHFTPEQVAAYIRDQNIQPANYDSVASMFGITPDILAQGVALLNANAPGMSTASDAYKAAVTADPNKGVANTAWVGNQSLATPTQQQSNLGVIDAYKNPVTTGPLTNQGGFTAAQVAAYIRDQNISPADYVKTATMFGVDPTLLSAGVKLLNANDPKVMSASDLYKQTIAGTNQGALNDAWVASQAARSVPAQQAELNRITGVRTAASAPNPIVNPVTGPLTQTSAPPLPAPSTAPNSFDTPVLNALYSQQRQNMTSAAPTFNFQTQPMKTGGPVGALHRAIRGY